jgi:hypothetical protein
MSENAVKPADEFLLSLVPQELKGFVPPEGPFDAHGAWTHRYNLYNMTSQFYPDFDKKVGMLPTGSLKLERIPKGLGGCTLAFELAKDTAANLVQHISGKLSCAGDALSTPISWDLTETLCAPFGSVAFQRTMRKSGKRAGGALEIAIDGATVRHDSPGAYSSNWALFDAVQRLPRTVETPLQFSLLDGCDALKRGHILAFRRTVNVELPVPESKKTTMILHRYDHRGSAFSPAAYWTDEQGRVVFFISGIDVWVMAPATS